jgi:hypothetical protein
MGRTGNLRKRGNAVRAAGREQGDTGAGKKKGTWIAPGAFFVWWAVKDSNLGPID